MLRPDRCHAIDMILLGDFLEVQTHWSATDGRIPCQGAACRVCPAKVQHAYYAPASFIDKDKEGFATTKAGLCELFDDQMEKLDRRPTKRGIKLKLAKTSTGKLWLAEVATVPEEFIDRIERGFDVVPALERIFGMKLAVDAAEADQPADVLKFRRRA